MCSSGRSPGPMHVAAAMFTPAPAGDTQVPYIVRQVLRSTGAPAES